MQNENLKVFFKNLEEIDAENYTKIVEKYLNDEDIDLFIEHLENFYGITDEEELGTLAQIMITGFLAGKNECMGITNKG